MKKNLLKQITCSLLVAITIVSSTTTFSATDTTKSETANDVSSLIPDDVVKYAESRLTPLSQTVKQNSDNFGIDIKNVYTLELGEPYVIYSSLDNGTQNPIYYFPVLQDNEIIMILSIIDDNGIYSAGLEEGIAEDLNTIGYQSDENYIFYTDEQNIYAESESDTEIIGSLNQSNNATITQLKNAKEFENLSFEKKINEINDTYAIDEPSDNIQVDNTQEILYKAQGFSTKTYNTVRLNTNKCTVSQGNEGLCWAACVATTVRYRNYSKYPKLTAKQVANKMEIGYNDGGDENDIKKALDKYGVKNYTFKNKQISFSKVKTNILNQYPFIIGAISPKGGHSVTGVGYTTYDGINQVTFYNSGTNKFATVEYKSSGTKFSYVNTTFLWYSSVSKYY